MRGELEDELPARVMRIMQADRLNVEGLLEAIGNETAATNDDIFNVLTMLSEAKELQVIKPDGGQKRWKTSVTARDTLVKPAQKTFKWR